MKNPKMECRWVSRRIVTPATEDSNEIMWGERQRRMAHLDGWGKTWWMTVRRCCCQFSSVFRTILFWFWGFDGLGFGTWLEFLRDDKKNHLRECLFIYIHGCLSQLYLGVKILTDKTKNRFITDRNRFTETEISIF